MDRDTLVGTGLDPNSASLHTDIAELQGEMKDVLSAIEDVQSGKPECEPSVLLRNVGR